MGTQRCPQVTKQKMQMKHLSPQTSCNMWCILYAGSAAIEKADSRSSGMQLGIPSRHKLTHAAVCGPGMLSCLAFHV